jgi:hypothetical protein
MDMAAVQLILFIHAYVGPTAPPSVSPAFGTKFKSPVSVLTTEERMIKSKWYQCGRVGLSQVPVGARNKVSTSRPLRDQTVLS